VTVSIRNRGMGGVVYDFFTLNIAYIRLYEGIYLKRCKTIIT
jgi:hypothetical protein